MKTIRLTDEQMRKLFAALEGIEEGYFDIDIDVDDNITVNASGHLETEGYVEDDFMCGYMNGTGARVETYRKATLELTARVYDENDNEEDAYIDVEQESEAERYLNAA